MMFLASVILMFLALMFATAAGGNSEQMIHKSGEARSSAAKRVLFCTVMSVVLAIIALMVAVSR